MWLGFLVGSGVLLAGDFQGQVLDDATGLPIEGARLTLDLNPGIAGVDYQEASSAFGMFRIPNVAAGAYTLEIQHPGYIPILQAQIVGAADVSEVFRLIRTAPVPAPGGPLPFFDVYVTVNGVMTGLPMKNTLLQATRYADAQSGVPLDAPVTATTDDTGFACFRGLKPGNHEIQVTAPAGWNSLTQRQDLTGHTAITIGLLPVKEVLNVRVTGMDPATEQVGNLGNVFVDVTGLDPEGSGAAVIPVRNGITGSNGRAQFIGLPRILPWEVQYKKLGYETRIDTVEYTAAGPKDVEATLDLIDTWIELTLVDDTYVDPSMLDGLAVQLDGLKNTNTEGIHRTETTGTAPQLRTFQTLLPGRYLLTVAGKGTPTAGGVSPTYTFSEYIEIYDEGMNPVEAHLAVVPAEITGLVVAAGEKGVENSQGDLHPSDVLPSARPLYLPTQVGTFEFREAEADALLRPELRIQPVEVDASGYFSVRLPPGRYGLIMAGETQYWGSHVLLTEVTPEPISAPALPEPTWTDGEGSGLQAAARGGGAPFDFPAAGQGWPFYQNWPPAYGVAPPANGTPNPGNPLLLESAEYNLDVFLRKQVASVLLTIGNSVLETATALEALGFKDIDGSPALVVRDFSELAGGLDGTPGISRLTPVGAGSDITADILPSQPAILTTGGGVAASVSDLIYFDEVPPGEYTLTAEHPRYDFFRVLGPSETQPAALSVTVPDWDAPGVLPGVNPTDPTFVPPLGSILPGLFTFESLVARPMDAGITVEINQYSWVEPDPPEDPFYELSQTETFDANSGFLPFDFLTTSYTGSRIFSNPQGMPTGPFTFWMNMGYGWYKGSVAGGGTSVQNIYSGGGPNDNTFDIGEDPAPPELGLATTNGGGGPGASQPLVDILVVNAAHRDGPSIPGATVRFQDGTVVAAGPGVSLPFGLRDIPPEDVTHPFWNPIVTGTNLLNQTEIDHHIVTTTNGIPREVLKIWVNRKFNLSGSLTDATDQQPIGHAQVQVRDRFGGVMAEALTDAAGGWAVPEPFGADTAPPFYIDVRAGGFIPWRQRYDASSIPAASNNTIHVGIELDPLPVGTITQVTYSHADKYLTGVSRGAKDQALDLVWDMQVSAPPQTFTLMGFDDADGRPGEEEQVQISNHPVVAYLVNTRGADGNAYESDNEFVFKPGTADNLAQLRRWLADVLLAGSKPSRNKLNIFHAGPVPFTDQGNNVWSASGTNRIYRLPPGPFRPIAVVRSQSGGIAVQSDYTQLATNSEAGDPPPLMTGVRLPTWIANVLNIDGLVQQVRDLNPGVGLNESTKNQLAAQLLNLFPKGKYVPVPSSIAAEITASPANGHQVLTYTYSLGIGAREGQGNDGDYSNWKNLLPDFLGMEFTFDATAGLDNQLPGEADFFLKGKVATGDIPFDVDRFTPDILRFDPGRSGEFSKSPSLSAELKVAGGRTSPDDSFDLLMDSTLSAAILTELDVDLAPVTQFLPGGLGALLKGLDKTNLLKLFLSFNGGLGAQLAQSWWTTQPPNLAGGTGGGGGGHVHHRSFLGSEIQSSTKAKFGFLLGGGIKGKSGSWLEGSAKLFLGGDTGDFDFDALVATLHAQAGWPYFESIQGQVFLEVEGKANLWLVTLEKSYRQVLAEIDFQWTSEPVFRASPMDVSLTRSTPADEPPPVVVETDPLLIQPFPSFGSFDFESGGAAVPQPLPNGPAQGFPVTEEVVVFTGIESTSGQMTIEVAKRSGSDFDAPEVIATAAGILDTAITALPNGEWLVVWSQINGADVDNLYPSSTVHYAVSNGDQWSAPLQIVAYSDVAAQLRLASQAGLTALAVLHTADGPDAQHFDVELMEYLNGSWMVPAIVLENAPISVFDFKPGDTGGTNVVMFAYTDGLTTLQSLTWDGVDTGAVVQVAADAPFDLSLGSDALGGFSLAWASPSQGIQFATYNPFVPAWDPSVTGVANVDASEVLLVPLSDGTNQLYLLAWVSGGDVNRLSYRYLDAAGSPETEPYVLEDSRTGAFTDLHGFARENREVRILARLSDGQAGVREFATTFDPPDFPARFTRISRFEDMPNLFLEGPQNKTYTLFTSTNLVDWIEWQDITVTYPEADILDVDAKDAPIRHYRADEKTD